MFNYKSILCAFALLLMAGQVLAAPTDSAALQQWQNLRGNGANVSDTLEQLLSGGQLPINEVVAAAVAQGDTAELIAFAESNPALYIDDAIAGVLQAGDAKGLVKTMPNQLDTLVPAAVDSGFADLLFAEAVNNPQVDQPGLRSQAVVSQATCPMTNAMIGSGFAMESAVNLMIDAGAQAQILGECLNIDVPGLGYTQERTRTRGRKNNPDPDPVSAG